MGKIFKHSSEVEPLKFDSQHEALKRYLIIIFLATIVITDIVTLNLVAYVLLYSSFRTQNIAFSIWYTVTTFTSISLLILALLLHISPSIPRSKTKKDDLLLNRDFIKITQELFKPTETKYKVVSILKSIFYLIGIPVFLANLVITFVGFFKYYI